MPLGPRHGKLPVMKYAIGTAIIVAGAFAAYWGFRVLRFKQMLDAFAAGAADGDK